MKHLLSLIPFVGIIYVLTFDKNDKQRGDSLYEYSQTLYIICIFIQFVSMLTLASTLAS